MLQKRCPQCEKQLPGNAPEGLCPECLMQQAMKSDTLTSLVSAEGTTRISNLNELSSAAQHNLEMTLSIGTEPGDTHTNLQVGTNVGSFRIERKLGEGGMGTVYEAFDEETNRRVALKILKHRLNTPAARARFLHEGRTAASINHTNSVYVYGTDSIDDKLVICMELVGQSNLQDIVRENGRLHYHDAVAAILQVIDGLEAASKVGVLHRDVKPSNCFVDVDGTIKVGDFGLSISTQLSEDSLDTQDFIDKKEILGTPAFSSPEQLRGDDLDIRADIYSLGVTLFYLTTGTLPFTAGNFVQLLATVLENPAPLATDVNPEVPRQLARVIQRCLAKTPASRWDNYDQLRNALLPFSSRVARPAGLGKRSLANLVDTMPISIASIVCTFSLLRVVERDTLLYLKQVIPLVAYVLFYFVFESWKGCTPGKALLGLKVQDESGNTPTLRRVFVRSLAFVLLPHVLSWLIPFFNFDASWSLVAMVVASVSPMVTLIAMFVVAKEKNGYAALHDRLSGTRVVEGHVARLERRQVKPVTAALPDLEQTEMIGPYHVLQTIGPVGDAKMSLGFDARLLRRVWIHHGGSESPLSSERRNLNRIGRLRWLNGHLNDSNRWDAFEAVNGKPLRELIAKPQKWSDVRAWLLDLTTELECAEEEGSLPAALGLNHLWISSDGRLKLLDFIHPATPRVGTDGAVDQLFDTAESDFASKFVRHVVHESLKLEESPSNIDFVRPLHATEFIETFQDSEANVDSKTLRKEILGLCRKEIGVSKSSKWTMLSGVMVLPVFFVLLMLFSNQFARLAIRSDPYSSLGFQVEVLQECLKDDSLNPRDVELAKVYFANEWSDFSRNNQTWRKRGEMFSTQDIALVDDVVNGYAEASEEEVLAAEKAFGKMFEIGKSNGTTEDPFFDLGLGGVFFVAFFGLPSMVRALLFPRGGLLSLFHYVVVRRCGRPAYRMQLLWRSVLWTLPAAAFAFSALQVFNANYSPRIELQPILTWAIPVMFLSVVVPLASMVLMKRGLLDRLAGTYVVHR